MYSPSIPQLITPHGIHTCLTEFLFQVLSAFSESMILLLKTKAQRVSLFFWQTSVLACSLCPLGFRLSRQYPIPTTLQQHVPFCDFNIQQEIEYLFLQGVIKALFSLSDSPGQSLALYTLVYTLASFVSCFYSICYFCCFILSLQVSLESLAMFHRSVMGNIFGKCSSLEHSLKSNLRQRKWIEVRKHTEKVYHKLHVLRGAEAGWQSHLDRSLMFMRELQFRL